MPIYILKSNLYKCELNMNPFYSRKIYCPVCESKTETETLVGEIFNKYYPVQREKDQYVPQWKWYDESWSHVNPYLYAIIFCPNCHYSNFQEEFSYKKNSAIPKHYTYLRKKRTEFPDIIKEFLKQVYDLYSQNIAVRDHKTAILGFMCSLFWETLLLTQNKHRFPFSNTGRLYLRLSWLYHELNINGTNDGSGSLSEVEQIVLNMIKHLKDFAAEGRKIPFLINSLTNHKKEQIGIVVDTLNYAVNELSEKTSEILGFFNESNTPCADPQTILLEKGFTLWDWAPKNEKEALLKSARNFEIACTHDEHLNDNASWKLLELVAYLYEKSELTDKRNACLREIIKSCHQKRALINGKLQKKISYAEKCDLELSLKKLNSYIEEISYSYKEKNQSNK